MKISYNPEVAARPSDTLFTIYPSSLTGYYGDRYMMIMINENNSVVINLMHCIGV